MIQQERIMVLSGPSGCGKTTLIQGLQEGGDVPLTFCISHTTRPPRSGEVDHREYHFVSPECFEEMVGQGAFIEWARVHGHGYGTSWRALEEAGGRGKGLVLLDIDVQGAQRIRERLPRATLVMVFPPDLPTLRERLVHREGGEDTVVLRRLQAAREELDSWHGYDYVVINNGLEQALRDLGAVVRSRLSLSALMAPDVRRILGGAE